MPMIAETVHFEIPAARATSVPLPASPAAAAAAHLSNMTV